jgi:hypothetical protein
MVGNGAETLNLSCPSYFEAVLFADRGHGARIQEPREEILAEWDKRNIIEAL